ncbi:hypothetical protein [uncultured Albimonas sp.]|uniref:hypothetical protein n=1 Tax=uncultured Albimonas sp. TaxID=1331701 RepID=UPI0030EF35CE
MPRVDVLSDLSAGRPPAPGAGRRRRAAGWLGLGALGLLAGLGGPTAALLAARAGDPQAGAPAGGDPVLAIVAPWTDVEAVVAQASGRGISPISAPLAALAVGEGPDFPERLKAAGAWLVLDGRLLAELCGAAG